MQKNFASALQLVLVHEGGYVDHPQDPGGATNKGVTLAVFQRFYGASRTKEELRAITDAQLEHSYKTGYWDTCQCDALPDGVDYVVFDQAVNSGPGQSAKWLQAAVGVAVDGAIGPQTIAAALQRAPAQVINTMCDARLAFLQRLRNGALWQTFGRGWQARVDGVRAAGQQLATGASASAAPVPVAADPSLMPSVEYEIVRRGSRGAWVEKLQEALGITGDGIFGPETEAALKAYQHDAGLTDDGVAGRKTYQVLGLIA
jgi:lysozyme family protein